MALLRRLSSSISEAMSLDLVLPDDDGDGSPPPTPGGPSSRRGSASASLHSAATAASSDAPEASLGRATESLLRTMRLDVVLLGSREEGMREALARLERQWELLERMREEHDRKCEEKDAAEGEFVGEGGKGKEKEKRVASSIDWDGAATPTARTQPRSTNQAVSQSMVVRKTEPEKVSSQLSNSNFDWGGVDDSVHSEARRASLLGSTGESLTNIINAAPNEEAREEVPILRRLFPRRDSGEGRRGRKDDEGSVAASVGKNGNGEKGWNIFAGEGNGNKKGEGTAESTGGNQGNMPAESPFRRLFRRNKELDGSSNTRETAETQPSPSNSSATNNSPNPAEEDEDPAHLASLQLKLRGCDAAASSLQQLLAFQSRNLLDLQHERNALRSSSEFDSAHSERELENLRNRLAHAKVERRRKARLLEESIRKKKKAVDQEERLKGELESIRTELFMLHVQMSKAEREGYTAESTERGREKVVIVGGSSQEPESESTEWRTGGYQQTRGQQRSRSTPDATGPSGTRRQYQPQRSF